MRFPNHPIVGSAAASLASSASNHQVSRRLGLQPTSLSARSPQTESEASSAAYRMLSSLCSLTNTARLAVYPDISPQYIQALDLAGYRQVQVVRAIESNSL